MTMKLKEIALFNELAPGEAGEVEITLEPKGFEF